MRNAHCLALKGQAKQTKPPTGARDSPQGFVGLAPGLQPGARGDYWIIFLKCIRPQKRFCLFSAASEVEQLQPPNPA